MYCTNCGAAVPRASKFCGACGRPVSQLEQTALDNPDPVPAEPAIRPALPETDPVDDPFAETRLDVDPLNSRPWVRFWAKALDVCLWTSILSVVVVILFPRWSVETSRGIRGLVLFAAVVPVHAALLSTWGTTVGKAMLGITVTRNGHKPNFGVALRRETGVYIFGLGGGLPIVSLVAPIAAYNRLKKQGISSWDEEYGTVVTHKKPSVGGISGTIVILVGVFILDLYSYSLQ